MSTKKVLIEPLVVDVSDLPPLPLHPGFADLVGQELGDSGTPADGFDGALSDLTAIVDALESGLVLLGGADGGDLDDTFAEILTLDPGPPGDNLAAALAAVPVGDALQSALGSVLTGAAPPTPTSASCPQGTGGTTPPCGTYGDSSISLDDDTSNCFAASVFPRVRIADGGCTFAYLTDNTSFAGTATVTATALLRGDARLFAISNDVVHVKAGGPCVSRVLFKLTPYRTGHFLARFTVKTNRVPAGEVWCMIVDVIP